MIRQEWLLAASPEAPCGPDLSYDADFLALEAAARGKPEQQYGETTIPAEEPVWADVTTRATALLDRSRDLRIVCYLARGLTRTTGLPGAAAAMRLARDLLDQFWEPLHPQLEFEGEPDPVIRANAAAEFGSAEGLVRDLRVATFLKTPAVMLTIRDAENILDQNVGASEGGVGADQLRATLHELITADPTTLGEAAAILEAANGIRSALLAHLDPTVVPDLAALVGLIKPIAQFVEDVRARATGAAAAADGGVAGAAAGAPAFAAPGEIRTRDDAVRTLDRVCEFLSRTEPTNPAPLLIRRAQRLMAMSFLDIIQDLAPGASDQVQQIIGAKAEG